MDYQLALSRSMAICGRSEKCVSEIKQKHAEWSISEDISDKIVELLIKERFIDEKRYAGYYVRDKFRFNQWGRVKIAFMLKSKHLPQEIIQEALESIDNEHYLELLTRILSEKKRSLKATSDYDLKAKLIRFAQGRGFEFEAIQQAINNIAH